MEIHIKNIKKVASSTGKRNKNMKEKGEREKYHLNECAMNIFLGCWGWMEMENIGGN
jgi:hypothetical protein